MTNNHKGVATFHRPGGRDVSMPPLRGNPSLMFANSKWGRGGAAMNKGMQANCSRISSTSDTAPFVSGRAKIDIAVVPVASRSLPDTASKLILLSRTGSFLGINIRLNWTESGSLLNQNRTSSKGTAVSTSPGSKATKVSSQDWWLVDFGIRFERFLCIAYSNRPKEKRGTRIYKTEKMQT